MKRSRLPVEEGGPREATSSDTLHPHFRHGNHMLPAISQTTRTVPLDEEVIDAQNAPLARSVHVAPESADV